MWNSPILLIIGADWVAKKIVEFTYDYKLVKFLRKFHYIKVEINSKIIIFDYSR